MTIAVTGGGVGYDELWEDESGGFAVFTINHSDYTSTHKIRVLPFDGTGAYTAPPAGVEANISETAVNFMTLLKAIYGAATSATFFEVYQTLSGHDGVQPFPYTFTGAYFFAAGTASGGNWPTFVEGGLAGLDTNGGRWQLHLPGPAISVAASFGRFPRASVGSPIQALMDYVDGVANGPVTAAKTAVVSHAGNPISQNLSWLLATNKRLRRHFRVA